MSNVIVTAFLFLSIIAFLLLVSIVYPYLIGNGYMVRKLVNKEMLKVIRNRYPCFENNNDFKTEIIFELKHFGYADDSPSGFDIEGYRKALLEDIEKICKKYSNTPTSV